MRPFPVNNQYQARSSIKFLAQWNSRWYQWGLNSHLSNLVNMVSKKSNKKKTQQKKHFSMLMYTNSSNIFVLSILCKVNINNVNIQILLHVVARVQVQTLPGSLAVSFMDLSWDQYTCTVFLRTWKYDIDQRCSLKSVSVFFVKSKIIYWSQH